MNSKNKGVTDTTSEAGEAISVERITTANKGIAAKPLPTVLKNLDNLISSQHIGSLAL